MILPEYLTNIAINQFIDTALAEDIGSGDHSTLAVVDPKQQCTARLLVKEEGIIAGLELASWIFLRFDPDLRIAYSKKDGDKVREGDIAFTVSGKARSILSTERLVLNCLQRMSGIATYTNQLCIMIQGTGTRLMDTRKTTPNFRLVEKWAVAIGGGVNHRFALYDMIMLKDNHVDLSGGVSQAIEKTRDYLKWLGTPLRIEVETRNLDEVRDAIRAGGIDVIMLDNMSPEHMKLAVEIIAGRYKTEASGGITEANLRSVADCGVDFISVGALTHSARSLDLSLKVKPVIA